MKTLMRNGRDRRSENPRMCHARKERVLLFGTDQRITSGPAARTAAFRGRIHGCTRTIRGTVRFFSLAPRAPSIHEHIENEALVDRLLHRVAVERAVLDLFAIRYRLAEEFQRFVL